MMHNVMESSHPMRDMFNKNSHNDDDDDDDDDHDDYKHLQMIINSDNNK